MISVPPLAIVAPMSVPREKTISSPPLRMLASLANPPDRMSNSDPDETTVPPESVPPARIFNVASFLTDSPL